MLNKCQAKAMGALESGRNVFLTGAAGTGKSHLTNHFLKGKSRFLFPVVASTGAAALLVGGRTFHSFFGLGTMAGGIERVVAEATLKDKVVHRLRAARGVLIDEVSMLTGPTLDAAERIARAVRERDEPWGGMQVVVVGDFRQLPPVSQRGEAKEWCFNSPAWKISDFYPVMLKTPMRSTHPAFLEVLNCVRAGVVTDQVEKFLNSRMGADVPTDITRLYGRRAEVEEFNLERLAAMPGKERVYHTVYWGKTASYEEQIRKNAPIPTMLRLKVGAFVMIRKNDPVEMRWVNGSLGWVESMDNVSINVKLTSGDVVMLEEESFGLHDGNGDEVAYANNFPLNLAYATTIHKSQGCTLDRMLVDLTELWEPGHAYVAMSRVRTPDGLFVANWDRSSIKSDAAVTDFHKRLFA